MDKCPFCKEENCNPAYYNGETWNPGHLRKGYNRSPECYERQIAALKTKYKELKDTYKDFVLVANERLEAWRATKPFFLMTPDILWEYGGEPEEIYQRLKDLNEL